MELNLMTAPLDTSLKIKSVDGPMRGQLMSRGLSSYTPCAIISRTDQSVIINIWGMTMALDGSLAGWVEVTPEKHI